MDGYRLSDESVEDLSGIWAFIAPDDPLAADGFCARILETCELLQHNPRIGGRREELARGLRSFPVGSYLIFYRVQNETVEIVRIFHGARDLSKLFPPEAE